MERADSVALKVIVGQSNELEAAGTVGNGYTDDVTKLTGRVLSEQASPELCLLNSTPRRKSGSSNTSGAVGATSTSSLGTTVQSTSASGDKMIVVVMIVAVVKCHMNGSPIAHNPKQ
eukprot:18300-Heterococcus_DN1.PRE.1